MGGVSRAAVCLRGLASHSRAHPGLRWPGRGRDCECSRTHGSHIPRGPACEGAPRQTSPGQWCPNSPQLLFQERVLGPWRRLPLLASGSVASHKKQQDRLASWYPPVILSSQVDALLVTDYVGAESFGSSINPVAPKVTLRSFLFVPLPFLPEQLSPKAGICAGARAGGGGWRVLDPNAAGGTRDLLSPG